MFVVIHAILKEIFWALSQQKKVLYLGARAVKTFDELEQEVMTFQCGAL